MSNSFPFDNDGDADVIVAVAVYHIKMAQEDLAACNTIEALNEFVDNAICDAAALLSIGLPAMGDELGDVYDRVRDATESQIKADPGFYATQIKVLEDEV